MWWELRYKILISHSRNTIPWLKLFVFPFALKPPPVWDWLCFIWFKFADINEDVRSFTSGIPPFNDVCELMELRGPPDDKGVNLGCVAIRCKFSESESIFCFWVKLKLPLDPDIGELMSGNAEVPKFWPCS